MADKSREFIVDYAKQRDLLTMYASVDRMNQHMVEGNTDGVASEQHLQQNIRSNFRELQSRQGIETEL
ncbi:hypothetical protein LCGC14_0693310 [marine sediment metagenome]|uniref:Uncharacterized protein n=1 Tax=marine sediment metagenome TaxID=412755 RepID=A0A0F9R560_9ZZZZ